jgi:vacuolar-type H+-ATPase subunit E/Vma4
MAENKPTQEQLAEIDARLAAAQPTAEQQAQIDARLAALNEQEMQEAEAARLAARSNAQRAFEEQGLTDRVPGVMRTIDKALDKIPGMDSLNRFLSQTLDSAALDYLPDSAKNYLAELGVGLPAGVNAEGMAGKMGEAVGMAAPYVALPFGCGGKVGCGNGDKINASHEHDSS